MDSGSADDEQETIRLVLPDKCSDDLDESPLSCPLCHFTGESFKDFATHLKSKEHEDMALDLIDVSKNYHKMANMNMVKPFQLKVEEEEEEKKTLVWWNISSCPIPPGYDPCQVAPRMKAALKKSWVSGHVTITAIGNLTHTPGEDVLRELSSTGINLIHAEEFQTDLFRWIERNSSPTTAHNNNIMLICGPREVEDLSRSIYDLDTQGYTILLAYPQRDPALAWLWESFLLSFSEEWLWTSLLEAESEDDKQEYKCSQTGESLWSCTTCAFAAQIFEDFITHFKGKEHANAASELVVSAPKT